jgi:hypothetical protein
VIDQVIFRAAITHYRIKRASSPILAGRTFAKLTVINHQNVLRRVERPVSPAVLPG